MRGTRIVIAKCLQQETLQRIHEGHQGINKCRERANRSVWWPGISSQITTLALDNNHAASIEIYRLNYSYQLPTPLPQRPWQMIASDLFTLRNTNYLLIVDYYSRYVKVIALCNTVKLRIKEPAVNFDLG